MNEYQTVVVESTLALLDVVDRNRVEWEVAFEASSDAASTYAKLADDLAKANDAYGAQLAADGKAGTGPLAGVAVSSDAFKMALKTAIATAPHLADLRGAVDVALRKRDRASVDVEIAGARLRGAETALRALSRLAGMLAEA
jgi:hypothetical protein